MTIKRESHTLLVKHIKQFKFVYLFLIICIILALRWFYNSQYYVSTEDAYISATIQEVSPEVRGPIITLYVKNNQEVHKGDPLFDIDPVPFQLAVEIAQAELALQQAKLAKADSQNSSSAQAEVEVAKTDLQQAELNLDYTKVVAKTNGIIANLTLHVGDMVQANENEPLFSIIDEGAYWVDANFKETDLEHIKPGQTVDVEVEMYPNHQFKGIVESISGGSGTAFSLLPPENATGNWVKITQRIPVRIRITNIDPKFPLRIGATALVTIHLKEK